MSDAVISTPDINPANLNKIITRSGVTEGRFEVGEPRVSPHTPLLLINNVLLILTTTTQHTTTTTTTLLESSSSTTSPGRGGGCRA